MSPIEYIIGGILLVLAIALIALIGLQQGKRRGLGASIAGQGASESYLAKNKIGGKDKSYQKITLVVAILFAVLVLTLFIIGSIDDSAEDTSSTVATSSVASTSSKAESSVAESSVAESSVEESAESSAAESAAE